MDLVRYLIQQRDAEYGGSLEGAACLFIRRAGADWELIDAGIRVQAIKKTDGQAGIVHYGTEVITDENRSICALLGVSIGLSQHHARSHQECFPQLLANRGSHTRMTMIPTYDEDIKLTANAARFREVSRQAEEILQLRRTLTWSIL